MKISRKYILIILFFYFHGVNAQDMFICDTTGIVQRNDSILRFDCNYYYNFAKLSKDSVFSEETRSNTPVTFKGVVRNGKLEGPISFLRNDSNIIQQGFMKDGLADSIFTTYRISLANYKMEAMKSFFRKGLKEGEETEYNEYGTIIYIRNYKEGLLEGDYKHYDDYGNLITQGTYKKGKKEEAWRENIIEKHYSVFSNYKNDELVDYDWVAFYENGKTFFEGNYDKENLKQGLFKIYDTDGLLKSTESYKDGKRDGYFTEYYNGKPVRKIKYKNDKIVKD